MIWLLSGTVVVSILTSALCSASETATFAIGTSQLRTMEEEGFRGANALAELTTRGNQTRAAVVFLNTLSNTLAVGIMVLLGYGMWDTSGGWWGLLTGSLAVLILGQGIPRLLASRHPTRFALAAAPAVLTGVKASRLSPSPSVSSLGWGGPMGRTCRLRKSATSVNSRNWGKKRGWSEKTSTS